MHRLAAKGSPPGDTNWVTQFLLILGIFVVCEVRGESGGDMLELMQKEFGLVVNTVNAGKCGSVQNWYEPPGGTWVTARRRIRGENVLRLEPRGEPPGGRVKDKWQWPLLALGAWRQGGVRQAVTENFGSNLGRSAWRWECYRWAVFCQTKSNRGTVMFPSATIGRGVHSMVIACVLGSKLCKLGCVTTGEESVGLDYEQDWLVGLDHERDSFVEAQ
ncbi:hypothetical protein DEO72_LG6g1096 [Vigna unguiculata]|uniref:Uncharacterized protein n=1 Tax=Vigna unguiculata TaxID=3917 RepID=A0A4D6M995_VIGUN|nr:hypothetical protein DEO72_LG6g1096 [Vigna unguiculata]